MSIGEFRTVENERGLIIKFKMKAWPTKVHGGFTSGKPMKKSAEARPPMPFRRTSKRAQKS
jgi:hypothetical protein